VQGTRDKVQGTRKAQRSRKNKQDKRQERRAFAFVISENDALWILPRVRNELPISTEQIRSRSIN